MDVRIGALRNFPFKPNVHLNYADRSIVLQLDGMGPLYLKESLTP